MNATNKSSIETDEIVKIAKSCRHFSMCKVDLLGCGVCASGLEKHYVSYFPEGRMDLFAALYDNKIPITEKFIEIADSCNLCGKCDYICYFTQELRPSIVMKALKKHIKTYLENGGEIVESQDDEVLVELKRIVGDFWATNDPAIAIAYHHDICPHTTYKMPLYVVMPNTKEEISSIIKLLNRYNITYVVRGNGASSHGLTFTDGVVLDLHRMNKIEFDEKNWSVKVEPGVASFEVQMEANKRGFRVHTAEPSALVCANIMTTGILSTFSTAYGLAADNYINAEFIDRDGRYFNLNDINAPNLFSYEYKLAEPEPYAICVSISMKLHAVTDDEDAIIVPFDSLKNAMDFGNECATRRIGLSIAILGSEFISSFIASTKKLTLEAKEIFVNKLDMPYLVLLIGDSYDIHCVRKMGYPFIDHDLYKILCQSIPSLDSAEWLDLLDGLMSDEPYAYLKLEQFNELAELALAPSPSQMTQGIDPDLQPYFEKLYKKPEMLDLVWLNTFRILSARYCREKPPVALVCYLPSDSSLIEEMQNELKIIADKHGIHGDLGFITPFDFGKRCIWEYDFYFDNHNTDEIARVRQVNEEAFALLEKYCENTGTIRPVRYLLNHGCCRKENLLYISPK